MRRLNVFSLLSEDDSQKPLFGSQLLLPFGRNLAYQNISLADIGRGDDDAGLIEIIERLRPHVRNVARDFLGAKLSVSRLNFKFRNMDGGENVVFDQSFRN